MPSPFPGMDPYLEDPGLWPDVHHGLISGLQAELNRQLMPNYFARVEDRVYLADDDGPGRAVIIPDARVMAGRPGDPRVAVPMPAVAAAGGLVVEPIELSTFGDDDVHEALIQVIDRVARAVVAVIEVLSPTNKVAGSRGRQSYLDKRRDVLSSPAHLVEIDLLRGGTPTFARGGLPPHDYLVHVSRARPDRPRRRSTVWPIPLAYPLPVVRVPLRGDDPDAHVNLQDVLASAFDRGAYVADIDYAADPVPPLTAAQAEWARQVVAGRPAAGPA